MLFYNSVEHGNSAVYPHQLPQVSRLLASVVNSMALRVLSKRTRFPVPMSLQVLRAWHSSLWIFNDGMYQFQYYYKLEVG